MAHTAEAAAAAAPRLVSNDVGASAFFFKRSTIITVTTEHAYQMSIDIISIGTFEEPVQSIFPQTQGCWQEYAAALKAACKGRAGPGRHGQRDERVFTVDPPTPTSEGAHILDVGGKRVIVPGLPKSWSLFA